MVNMTGCLVIGLIWGLLSRPQSENSFPSTKTAIFVDGKVIFTIFKDMPCEFTQHPAAARRGPSTYIR